jgi:cyclophilin family peptidyl-prolyl cis-trans isomerase
MNILKSLTPYKWLGIAALSFMLTACENESAMQREARRHAEEQERVVQEQVRKQEAAQPKVLDISIDPAEVKEVLTAYGKENPETIVMIHTSMGDVKVKLYEDTPLHRANFIRLIKNGYYDNSIFNRVVKDFVVQGGRAERRYVKIGNYRVPAEFKPQRFHKKGALAMARTDENNPNKESSPRDFYFVLGQTYNNPTLDQIEKQYNINLTAAQRKAYTSKGGVPQLDKEYTVFGEVLEGMSVLEKISRVEVKGEVPLRDVMVTEMKVIE